MAEMVRKQIYIEERHERLLKRISKVRGSVKPTHSPGD